MSSNLWKTWLQAFCKCEQVYLLKSEEKHFENELMILGAIAFAPNLKQLELKKWLYV